VNAVLAAAFLDDPVFNWIVPDRDDLSAVIEPMFALFTAAFARHDEIHVATVDGAVAGTALWAPPGVPGIHPDDAEGFEDAIAVLAGDHVERLGTCIAMFEAVHPEAPAWYLNFVAVDPAFQGRGLGSSLFDAVLPRADAAGEPAYLEATSDRNRALYERHGFRSVGLIELPDGPTVHQMWRQPRNSSPEN
jgi:ribosomal protein S18 acetylase RimI-like enzyme